MFQWEEALHVARRAGAPGGITHQLRLDVSSTGVVVAVLERDIFRIVQAVPALTYEEAMSRAAHEIRVSRFLQPGYTLSVTLWPDTVRHQVMLIGAGQPYASALDLDARVQIAPEDLRLESDCVYRVIDNGFGTRADCVGISTVGWEQLEEALPDGVAIARHWGPLASLDVLISHYRKNFSADGPMLVGILDASRVFYFHVENDTLRGVQIHPRATLLQPEHLHRVIHAFQAPNHSKLLLASLSQQSSDVRALSQTAEVYITAREELLRMFRILQGVKDTPLLPIAVLQGGLA